MKDAPALIRYDDEIVRRFTLASVFWGVAGLLFGLIIALQLAFPALNLGLPYTTFGRLRPLHTNAAIFAFVGNMVFAGVYYSTQRLLKTRLACPFLAQVHFWGWQLVILLAAVTLPLGYSRSKEYAELIWPIDVLVAFVWVVFGVVFFTTLARRRELSLYVAVWFYRHHHHRRPAVRGQPPVAPDGPAAQLPDLRRRPGRARPVVVRA